MPITVLDQAIQSHSFRPKGIKVGSELWKKLVSADRIKWKRRYLKGASAIDSGIDLPFLNEDIFVHVAPELEDFEYKLPKA